jgi:hypothetical protein
MKSSVSIAMIVLSLSGAMLSQTARPANGAVPCGPTPNGMNVYWFWKAQPDPIYFDTNYVGPDAAHKSSARVNTINACSTAKAFDSPYPCPYQYRVWQGCPAQSSRLNNDDLLAEKLGR